MCNQLNQQIPRYCQPCHSRLGSNHLVTPICYVAPTWRLWMREILRTRRNGTKSWYIWWNLPTNPAVLLGFKFQCQLLTISKPPSSEQIALEANTNIWLLSCKLQHLCRLHGSLGRAKALQASWLLVELELCHFDNSVYNEAITVWNNENRIGCAKLSEIVKANYIWKNKSGTAWYRLVQDSIRQSRAKSNASKQIHAQCNVYCVYIRICVMHMKEKIKKHDSYNIWMQYLHVCKWVYGISSEVNMPIRRTQVCLALGLCLGP